MPALAAAMLGMVNAARAQPRMCGDKHYAAAGPLELHPLLNAAALAHSQDMVRRNFFEHDNPDGESPWERAKRAGYTLWVTGENIYRGPGSSKSKSVGHAMKSWLKSPGHCRGIMGPHSTLLGVGLATNPKRHEQASWTQLFGSRPKR